MVRVLWIGLWGLGFMESGFAVRALRIEVWVFRDTDQGFEVLRY
jgi:hypothetical protein